MQLILLFLNETVQDMFDDRYFASFAFPLAEVVNLYEHLEVLFLDGDILLRQLVVVVDEGGASVLVDTEDEAEDEGLAGVLGALLYEGVEVVEGRLQVVQHVTVCSNSLL